MDEGGDGGVDRTVAFGERVAGAAASDHSQPVSRVAMQHVADPNRGPIARVTVTATDRGGSGIGRIEYGLDPSGISGVYTSPLEVPAVGWIVVRAIDRAGNIQAPYSRVMLRPSKG